MTAWLRKLWDNRKLRKRHKELRVTVRELLAFDDDILSDDVKEQYRALQTEIRQTSKTDARNIEILEKKLAKLHDRKEFRYVMRNFLDVLAVALAVAFGIRGLFMQPFKIPTSSMQPTLFGIHYVDTKEAEPYTGFMTKLFRPLGASRAKITVQNDGDFREGGIQENRSLVKVLFSILNPAEFYIAATRVMIGSDWYRLPGHDVVNNIYRYMDNNPQNVTFRKGETVMDGWVSSGDHLFVDRVSLHFNPLKRGEIFIFNTENLRTFYDGRPLTGYYYIKRIAGIGGDTLKVVDNVLYIRPKGEKEFRRADELCPQMKKLYSFRGGYQGHAPLGLLADGMEITVPDQCYFALGDNTNNSLDSRMWGAVPHRNIIGRPFNIFWPVSRRWGFVDRLAPLDCATRFPKHSTQPTAMRLQ